MGKTFRMLMIVLILGISGALAGCKGTEKTSAESKTDLDSKAKLSWMAILYHQQPPKDRAIKEIEKLTNTELDITWVPDAVKEDRLNAALAAGNLPQIVSIQDIKNSSVMNAFRSGMFWEIGDYIKDYPNLRKMNKLINKNVSVDGKLYGIYRERPLSRQGVVIRKDWLENLNMKTPESLEDLFETAKAFTEKDPDGNGKNDTIGITDRNDLIYGAFKTLGSYQGMPTDWKKSNGTLTPDFMTKEYKETMDYMKKLRDKGYMNKDFPVTSKTQQQELFSQGKAGIYIGNMVDAVNLRDNSSDKSMELEILNRIKGSDGKERIWASGGHNGLFAFPKTSVKTEAELKRILAFFDRIAEEDVYSLMTYGIDGVHYNKGKGKTFTREESQVKDWQTDIQPLSGLIAIDKAYLKNTGDPLRTAYEELTEDNNKIIVANPAESLYSAAASERGEELQKIIDDATYKYILGEINESQFNKEIEKWKTNGGKQIIEEYEASLKKE
ncbi:extracellular solute-binding protein [Bacillus atrophaeus]|uniref:extracellular solute-binding protein n=1 Tax=Bacillus atrophaeus TaxID=1452 RepID=UPI00227F06FB|nr:extracellular solute-binding protein [Bacillus atrophaeus]MCY8971231.1 extracellular solute-binding protein [Bacillus atrophaeus]